MPHVVQRGESLWSIARTDAISPAALAAANGLSTGASLISGSVVQIPATGSGSGSAASGEPDGDSDDMGGATVAPTVGAYVVRPGDTLSAIAARAGVTTSELAAANGLNAAAPLLYGTVLRLGAGAPASGPLVTAAATRVLPGGPVATPVRLSGDQIGSIAAANGVPPSLARAIAWQESGFNNAAVSSANARGVMQIIPPTWSWIQRNLALTPLDPASANDNVKAGVLLLGQLLRDTGGSEPAAIAGYYQGLASVRRIGMLPSTQRYVSNVLALQGR